MILHVDSDLHPQCQQQVVTDSTLSTHETPAYLVFCLIVGHWEAVCDLDLVTGDGTKEGADYSALLMVSQGTMTTVSMCSLDPFDPAVTARIVHMVIHHVR